VKESYPVIVYSGRLTRAKRCDHAIRSFKIIKNKFPNAELWIIGDGYLRKNLEKIAITGVKFFDHLHDRERRELIKRAWVLVNPSIGEGFGLNVLEANALGVPCIAYDVRGLKDSIKNGETGLLVKSGDINALTREIIKVLEDEELRWRLSKNALEYSRSFSWDATADIFMDIMEKILLDIY
jgi:glycosyltransferase involved in cell wall biosynthesis